MGPTFQVGFLFLRVVIKNGDLLNFFAGKFFRFSVLSFKKLITQGEQLYAH